MTATIDSLRFILYDIKYSWWFRFWGLLWIVGVIVTFVALGVLGHRADIAGKENDNRIWYENATTMNFPRFHFRIAPDAPDITYTATVCSHNGFVLPTFDCTSFEGYTPLRSVCVGIHADSFSASNSWNAPRFDGRIDCFLNTSETAIDHEDHLIAFEMEGDNHATGGDSLASVWVAPTDNAWILLRNDKIGFGGMEFNDWSRKLIYHTSTRHRGEYHISVIIGSFFIRHIEQGNSFSGWRALGDVGGFGYFMVILHSIIMSLVVGICFTNNSKFLGGVESE